MTKKNKENKKSTPVLSKQERNDLYNDLRDIPNDKLLKILNSALDKVPDNKDNEINLTLDDISDKELTKLKKQVTKYKNKNKKDKIDVLKDKVCNTKLKFYSLKKIRRQRNLVSIINSKRRSL